MSDYTDFIKNTPLFDSIDTTTTTGDLDYNGTALEVATPNGTELFHVVVDEHGKRQFLFFSSKENYRLPVELLESVILAAKQNVHAVDANN